MKDPIWFAYFHKLRTQLVLKSFSLFQIYLILNKDNSVERIDANDSDSDSDSEEHCLENIDAQSDKVIMLT